MMFETRKGSKENFNCEVKSVACIIGRTRTNFTFPIACIIGLENENQLYFYEGGGKKTGGIPFAQRKPHDIFYFK